VAELSGLDDGPAAGSIHLKAVGKQDSDAFMGTDVEGGSNGPRSPQTIV
jgi:hypothetical protein